MANERGETSDRQEENRVARQAGLFGSLKDALRAAGREDAVSPQAVLVPAVAKAEPAAPPIVTLLERPEAAIVDMSMSAVEAARHARTLPAEKRAPQPHGGAGDADPPTTRVVRSERHAPALALKAELPVRTQLVRGRREIVRSHFVQDPVVGFLIVVGGPGLGASRPIYEGNNTVGRAASNRIALDFGDETISHEAQAFIRYDAHDRSFLFVPNLAKTNVVSVNDTRPTGAVELKAMDVVTFGRTQVAFLPFCGPEFDWSEISDAKVE